MGIQLYLTYEERMEDIKDWLFKEHNKLCHEAAMKDPTNHIHNHILPTTWSSSPRPPDP